MDLYAILIYLGTNVMASYTFEDKIVVCPINSGWSDTINLIASDPPS
jgi:hypothetical protein